MGSASRVRQVLSVLPDELSSVREALKQRWAKENEEEEQEEEEEGLSSQRWNTLAKHLSSEGQIGESSTAEILTQFCYPRLDVNVSIGKPSSDLYEALK